MSKEQGLYLQDILERILRIQETAAAGEAVFRTSYMHQDTIIRNFEVIGEIVKRLNPELTARYPEIHWTDYAGFRDILIHQYDKVVLDIVWESVERDLEALKIAVEKLLTNEEKGE